jgi:lysophospholipase L1-like esterase
MGTEAAKNRSINGADTHTILGRLEGIIQGKPLHVLLMCGINNFQKGIPLQRSINEYKKIVDEILSISESTNIWPLPILPINKYLYRQLIVPDHPGINIPNQEMVQSMNTAIASLQNHPKVYFCDMPNLLNDKGELSNKYTFDGLHLNGLGLIKIAETLKSIMF